MNQTRNRPGYPGGLMGEVGFCLIDRPVLFQKHLTCCGGRCGLAVVDKDLFIGLGKMNQHEAAAANVACSGKRHSQRKPCRHSCINGIAALLEHIEANLAGQLLRAHDHAFATVGGQVAVLVIDNRRVCCGHCRQGALGIALGNVAQREYRANSEKRGGQASDEGVS